jgi:diaminopimelate decarboxylase
MIKAKYPVEKFLQLQTPFYYYDMDILRQTLQEVNRQVQKRNYVVHYAVKANANPVLLREIKNAGFGADCVSGGEINAAIKAGFPKEKNVFAGVGKADWELIWHWIKIFLF